MRAFLHRGYAIVFLHVQQNALQACLFAKPDSKTVFAHLMLQCTLGTCRFDELFVSVVVFMLMF